MAVFGNKKVVTTIVVLILVALIVYFAYRIVDKYFKVNSADNTTPITSPDVNKIDYDKNNLTINQSDAIVMANSLYSAMADYGTNKSIIYGVFDRLNTRDDLLLLIKTFGLRRYWMGTRSVYLGNDIGLNAWLSEELSAAELIPVTKKYKQLNVPF